MSPRDAWNRYRQELWDDPDLGMQIDFSRMGLSPAVAAGARGRLEEALRGMSRLEAGAVANPDENRRVGHYWLRAPELAPDPDLRAAIEDTASANRRVRRRRARRARSPARRRPLRAPSRDRHRWLRARPAAPGPRSGFGRRRDDPPLPGQHGSGRLRPGAWRNRRCALPHAHPGDLQVGRHEGNAKRDGRDGSRLPSLRAGIGSARGGGDGGGERARSLRQGLRVPRRVPDVGLGRRAHLADVRGGTPSRGFAGNRCRRAARRSPRHGRADPCRGSGGEPRRPARPRLARAPATDAATGTWSCFPTRTGFSS